MVRQAHHEVLVLSLSKDEGRRGGQTPNIFLRLSKPF